MSFLITFLTVFVFWIMLSGEFDILLLVSAAISSALVAYFTHGIFMENVGKKHIYFILAFLGYIPWLLWQVIVANVEVAYLVLHPRLPIDPDLFKVKTALKDEMCLTILGNTITLTPGTVTVDINENELLIHAISKKHAADIIDRTIEKKVLKLEGLLNV